jgi:cation:H+ antiporter
MLLIVPFLLLSFIILWFSAEAMVSQMKALSTKFRLSSLFVGTVFMSFITTLPELTSSIYAALLGDYPLAYANTTGSVIVNILFVFALGVLLGSVRIGTKKTQFESAMLFGLSVVFVSSIFLVRIQSLLLLTGFIFSWITLYRLAKDGAKKEDKKQFKLALGQELSLTKTIFSILGIFASSVILIQSIERISILTGIDTSRLGLMILATSTSLPEVVTMLISSKKGEYKLLIGNIVGSSVYTMFFVPIVIGFGSNIIAPQNVLVWIIIATLLLFLVVRKFKGQVVPKYIGILFIACFILYFLSIM